MSFSESRPSITVLSELSSFEGHSELRDLFQKGLLTEENYQNEPIEISIFSPQGVGFRLF